MSRQSPALTPLDAIKASERFIASEVKLGLSTTDEACAVQMLNLIEQIRKMSDVTLEHATEANERLAIDAGSYNEEQRTEIAKVIKAVVQSNVAMPMSKAGTVMQKCPKLYNYMPAKLWAILFALEAFKCKLQMFAAFLVQNLGLRHPDENTKRMAVVITHTASKMDPDPQSAYDHVHDFAEYMDQKRTAIKSAQTMIVFPDDPADFIKVYPTAYGPEDPPVACRIDEATIVERMRPDITPTRSSNDKVHTRRRVKGHPVSTALAKPHPAQPVEANNPIIQAMLQFKAMKAFMEGDGRASDIDQLRLEIFGDRGTSSRPPAALEDAPLPPSKSPLAFPGGFSHGAEPVRSTIRESPVSGGIPAGCLIPPARKTEVDSRLSELTQNIEKNKAQALAKAAARKVTNDKKVSEEKATKKRKQHDKSKKIKDDDGDDDSQKDADGGEEDDNDDGEAVDKGTEPPTKKKSGHLKKTPGTKPKLTTPMKKAFTMKERERRYQALLRRPAAAPRPRVTLKKPVPHHGGKIYFSEAKRALRVYKRVPADKVEETVSFDPQDAKDCKTKWSIACAIIEADPRPTK